MVTYAGWSSELPRGDTDDLNMPVYYYTGNNSATPLPGTSWAERSLYDWEELRGFNPINMGFNNRFNYEPLPILQVELSDQLLEWFVNDYPAPNNATHTLLAGSRVDNNTGITLEVYSGNNEGGGANLTFSEVNDLVGVRTGDTLPTMYAFRTQTGIPPQDTLIRAANLNTTTYNCPPEEYSRFYIWSAVVIEKTTKRQQYRDNFTITVQNITVP